jgi:2'-5' RNA ligase
MLTLQAAIQKKLDRLGYRGESRRYVPHLTIGKARGDASSRSLVRELAGLADFQAGKMFVDEVMVFSSELRPEGPIYDVLARAPLAT